MFDFWEKMPRWLRDSISVTVLMTILLIAYDLISPLVTHQPYSMTMVMYFPFQVLVAFAVIALYNYHKQVTLKKEKEKREEAARLEKLKKEQQERQHDENARRNQSAAQKQRHQNQS